MAKREQTRREWEQLIAQWRKSGKSAVDFCRERNLVYRQFMRWRRRMKPAAKTTGKPLTLIPITTPMEQSHALVVRLSGGVSIAVERGFDAALLIAVVQALRESPRC
jgi:hypothetical protein